MVPQRFSWFLVLALHFALLAGCTVVSQPESPPEDQTGVPPSDPPSDPPAEVPVEPRDEPIWVDWELDLLGRSGREVHLDPVRGSLDNPGTAAEPLPGLDVVLEHDLIERWVAVNKPHTGDPLTPLEIANPGAPIQPGDRLILHGGDHGYCEFNDSHGPDYLLISGAPGEEPVLRGLSLVGVERVVVEGVTVRRWDSRGEGEDHGLRLIEIMDHSYWGPSGYILIRDCDIESIEDASGWSASEWVESALNGVWICADHVSVRENRLTNMRWGVFVAGGYAAIVDNVIRNFCGDGIQTTGHDHYIAYNHVSNSYKVDDNHDDGYQCYNVAGEPTCRRITLRGNTFISTTDLSRPLQGPMNGIGCFNGFFDEFVIENNLIVTDEWQGIELRGARDCRIVNNTLADVEPGVGLGPPLISIKDHRDGIPSSGNLIRNNVVHNIVVESGTTVDHNLVVYEALDVFVDPAGLDFRPRAGGPAVDAGTADLAPAWDLTRTPRPRGGGVDLGAFER